MNILFIMLLILR